MVIDVLTFFRVFLLLLGAKTVLLTRRLAFDICSFERLLLFLQVLVWFLIHLYKLKLSI